VQEQSEVFNTLENEVKDNLLSTDKMKIIRKLSTMRSRSIEDNSIS